MVVLINTPGFVALMTAKGKLAFGMY